MILDFVGDDTKSPSLPQILDHLNLLRKSHSLGVLREASRYTVEVLAKLIIQTKSALGHSRVNKNLQVWGVCKRFIIQKLLHNSPRNTIYHE